MSIEGDFHFPYVRGPRQKTGEGVSVEAVVFFPQETGRTVAECFPDVKKRSFAVERTGNGNGKGKNGNGRGSDMDALKRWQTVDPDGSKSRGIFEWLRRPTIIGACLFGFVVYAVTGFYWVAGVGWVIAVLVADNYAAGMHEEKREVHFPLRWPWKKRKR